MTDTSGVPRIFRLTGNAISQIQSSKHISSLPAVVFALVENSLDAGSRKIRVAIDWPRGSCTVEDDGHGISPTDFERDGGLGQMYCTSKRQPDGEGRYAGSELHGTNGTFLADLASLSMLSIVSKTLESPKLGILTFHHGRTITQQTRALQDGESPFHEPGKQHGTLITVRDLFGNMPVRLKQRALADPEQQKSWHELKRGILALLLAWPGPCVVKICDAKSDSRTVNLASQRPANATELTRKNLLHLSGTDQEFDLRDVLSLLFQAGFASPESRHSWIPQSATTSALRLKGLICLDPAPTRECQFISLGIHPCARNSGYAILYEAVAEIFRKSDFGKVKQSEWEFTGKNHRSVGWDASGSVQKPTQARKGVDRFAMFYIQVLFQNVPSQRHESEEILSDSLLAAVIKILKVAVSSWLDKNHFQPEKQKRTAKHNRIASSTSTLLSPTITAASNARSPQIYEKVLSDRSMPSLSLGPPLEVVSASSLPLKWSETLASRSRIRSSSASAMSSAQSTDPTFPIRSLATGESDSKQLETMGPASESKNGRPGSEHFARSAIGTRVPFKDTHESGATTIRFQPQATLNVSRTNPVSLTNGAHQPDEAEYRRGASDDFGSIDDNEMIAAESAGSLNIKHQEMLVTEQFHQWVDPMSKQAFNVNSRTGIVAPIERIPPTVPLVIQNSNQDCRHMVGETSLSSGTSSRLTQRSKRSGNFDMNANHRLPPRLPDFLRSWNNPVFTHQSEAPIPATSVGQDCGVLSMSPEISFPTAVDPDDGFNNMVTSGTLAAQMSKAELQSMQIIGQVDRKFILCRSKTVASIPVDQSSSAKDIVSSEETLILVDQHAASERVIVETLLKEYFNCLQMSSNSGLPNSLHFQGEVPSELRIQFDVTSDEHNLFNMYRDHFAFWGVRYDVLDFAARSGDSSHDGSANREFRVVVKSLPPVIAERCVSVPKICIDMMRAEAWALVEGTRRPVSSAYIQLHQDSIIDSSEIEGLPAWLKRVVACPQGILDMINSRACRSAIMFNDILTVAQCQSLMDTLATCTFPFVCAHGRIGMTPLLRLNRATDVSPPDANSLRHDGDGCTHVKQPSFGALLNRWALVRD